MKFKLLLAFLFVCGWSVDVISVRNKKLHLPTSEKSTINELIESADISNIKKLIVHINTELKSFADGMIQSQGELEKTKVAQDDATANFDTKIKEAKEAEKKVDFAKKLKDEADTKYADAKTAYDTNKPVLLKHIGLIINAQLKSFTDDMTQAQGELKKVKAAHDDNKVNLDTKTKEINEAIEKMESTEKVKDEARTRYTEEKVDSTKKVKDVMTQIEVQGILKKFDTKIKETKETEEKVDFAKKVKNEAQTQYADAKTAYDTNKPVLLKNIGLSINTQLKSFTDGMIQAQGKLKKAKAAHDNDKANLDTKIKEVKEAEEKVEFPKKVKNEAKTKYAGKKVESAQKVKDDMTQIQVQKILKKAKATHDNDDAKFDTKIKETKESEEKVDFTKKVKNETQTEYADAKTIYDTNKPVLLKHIGLSINTQLKSFADGMTQAQGKLKKAKAAHDDDKANFDTKIKEVKEAEEKVEFAKKVKNEAKTKYAGKKVESAPKVKDDTTQIQVQGILKKATAAHDDDDAKFDIKIKATKEAEEKVDFAKKVKNEAQMEYADAKTAYDTNKPVLLKHIGLSINTQLKSFADGMIQAQGKLKKAKLAHDDDKANFDTKIKEVNEAEGKVEFAKKVEDEAQTKYAEEKVEFAKKVKNEAKTKYAGKKVETAQKVKDDMTKAQGKLKTANFHTMGSVFFFTLFFLGVLILFVSFVSFETYNTVKTVNEPI